MSLNSKQKFQALRALDPDICIKISIDNQWYVSTKLECQDSNFVSGLIVFSDDLETLIDTFWDKIMHVSESQKLRITSLSGSKYVKWNGFMWEEIE